MVWHILMHRISGYEHGSRIKEYYENVSKFPGLNDELKRYETDLAAMTARMKEGKAGNFQKK